MVNAALLLSALTLPAVPVEAGPVDRPSVLVDWSDPQGTLPANVLEWTAQETEALFRGWGVTPRLSPAQAQASCCPVIRVILLDRRRLGGGPPLVLGRTSAGRQEQPAVWVLVPNVREVLQASSGEARPQTLARALARVAAHEIVHVLAPGLPHSAQGLMRARFDAATLTRPFAPGLSNAFRSALLSSAAPPPTPPATVQAAEKALNGDLTVR
jgi:hypothetical protein